MYAYDAITEAGVWRTLKRMLNHARLEIQPHPLSRGGGEVCGTEFQTRMIYMR